MDFVKWEKWSGKKVERKKSGAEKKWSGKEVERKKAQYESITAIKKKIKTFFGFVIFQPCKIVHNILILFLN